MNSSSLPNELVSIFRNASIGTAVLVTTYLSLNEAVQFKYEIMACLHFNKCLEIKFMLDLMF